MHERSYGVDVRGTERLAAVGKLAAHLGIGEFKGSEGWLWRFRNRQGLFNKVLHSEAGDADESSVAPFREKLKKLISDEGLSPSQIYNADNTLRTYVDALMDYSSYSQLPEMAHHSGSLQMIKELIIKEQRVMGC